MSENKLKPCPFCGGEAQLAIAPSNEYVGIPCYAVTCKHCKVMMGTVQKGQTDFYRTAQEAIEIWNTRKPMERIVEELDGASDYYECEEQGREHVQMIDLIDAIEIVQKGGAG